MTAELDQGTEAWLRARLGKVTASRLADVVAKTKSGWGASRYNYMAELVAQRLTGQLAQSFTNAAMQWGTEHEADARKAYEDRHGVFVEQVGFLEHPRILMTGASPDGLVNEDGLIELKCPNTATHIETLLGAEIDKKYLLQMQWQMACTGRAWCDFGSYDCRMPEPMQLHVRRVQRDDALIATLEKDVSEFLAELSLKVKDLEARYQTEAA